MNQKEIKSVLKAAKESLDQKDYKAVIKQCKSVLKVDRNNYFALVFYGAAVQETEQKDEAPKAFKKAIEISPEHILAWRGLASYYEKIEECDPELLKIYAKLLILETVEGKLPEIIKKFEKLSFCQSDIESAKLIFDSMNSFSDEKKHLIKQCLVNIFAAKTNLSEDLLLGYQKLLEELLAKKPHLPNHSDLAKQHLKVLFKQRNFKKTIIEATEFSELYPEDIAFLEWTCQAYSELPEEDLQDLADYSPKEAFTRLAEYEPESYLAYFCKGVYEFHSGDYLSANQSLKQSVKLGPNSGSIWLKLCLSQIILYQFSEAEESARKAISFLKNKNNKIEMCKVKLLQCLSEQDDKIKLEEAVKLGKQLSETISDNLEILQFLITAETKLGMFAEAEEKLKVLSQDKKYEAEAKYLKCVMLKRLNKLEDFKKGLEELVSEMPSHYKMWLTLGKHYYNEKNYNSSLNCLLKSAKLNQWCYQSFLLLGHCYRTLVQDLEKARRCYQKAFQLNPNNCEIGVNLSDVYRILGKKEENLELLTMVTKMNPRSNWAWLKLGLHYILKNELSEAVNSLRIAVRLDANNKNAWECLGDAYFAQGAYTSALKSYQRVQELDEKSIYPLLQIASINHLMGLYTESVEKFRLINGERPNYIPALKGYSEACVSLVKQYLSQNLNGLAQNYCQEAVCSLIKCLQQRKDLICIWKLLGDACTLLSELPEKYCNLLLPLWLSSNSQIESSSEVNLNKMQILKLGLRSYCQAIALNPDLARLWYDLAFVYNKMAENSKTRESRKQQRDLACSAAKKSISLDGNSWESWNLYGILLASREIKNYYLAQHCFIKSILKNDTNAVTWTNLGTLYLDLEDLQIANQSFTEAQRCDHDYVYCWVGQAIIAQMTCHHDAMDLFRHSTQLGFSGEGCLGYCNLVCLTLLNTKNKNDKNYLYSIKNMNAVTVASDALTWFTDRYPDNGWAWNMLGLLLERQMLYRRSVEAFSAALKVIEKDSEKNGENDRMDKVLLNYSRVLSKLNRFKEAIEHLQHIKKATFTNQCEMAVAYFRAKLYEEAYSSYKTTLEWLAPDTKFKSHILVAMAAVVYLHQGPEDAKILLMQSCQLKPPSVEGLFALCALGMLHSDLELSELALRELNLYKDDTQYLGHISVFQSYIYLFKGQKERAIRALCKVIHRHPNQPSLWLSISLLLLHLYPSFDCRSAARSAEKALTTGRSSIDVSKVMSLVGLSNLLSNEGLKSLSSSQKAVHMFPDATENWVVLVASVLFKCLVKESMEELFWLKKMITYIRRKFESSKPMTQWLSNNNRKIVMMVNNMTSLLSFLSRNKNVKQFKIILMDNVCRLKHIKPESFKLVRTKRHILYRI